MRKNWVNYILHELRNCTATIPFKLKAPTRQQIIAWTKTAWNSLTASSALEGAKLAFEAERLSPLQIRDLAEKKLNKKIELRYVDLEENKKNFNTDFVAFLTTIFEEGRGVAGTEQEVADTAAKFFPDWNPAKYESFIA
ncbi:hypothetical protein PR003_g16124 [Phytophthora rubi]|uniref:DDE-1 domain-containing protein n=1 Tax=Phytophthora rubi TaxID=129364 RepID=A0A6A4EJ23_9STRA|nr:hypothetical protein PR003_g16124 [Phytophthora rubi]